MIVKWDKNEDDDGLVNVIEEEDETVEPFHVLMGGGAMLGIFIMMAIFFGITTGFSKYQQGVVTDVYYEKHSANTNHLGGKMRYTTHSIEILMDDKRTVNCNTLERLRGFSVGDRVLVEFAVNALTKGETCAGLSK